MSGTSSLMQRWHTLATYIDGRNPRERALLFLVTLAVAAFICYLALFKPLSAYESKIHKALSINQSNLVALQEQNQEMLGRLQLDPDLSNRARLEELTRQLEEVSAPMAELMRGLVPPKEMTALVKALLSSRKVRVVSVENLPPEAITAHDASRGDGSAAATAPLYKHGLRIVVQGGFHDILGFFGALEKLSWKVLWDQADIRTEHYPASTAEVTVYTLSMDESWIRL